MRLRPFSKEHGHNNIEIDQYVDLHQPRFFSMADSLHAGNRKRCRKNLTNFMARIVNGRHRMGFLHPADP